jgi:Fic family protein
MPQPPPFNLTPAIIRQIAEIGEALGRLSVQTEQATALRLRRINRIRTIQGSLAIEGNTLTEEQITAILDGKRVLAPPREVQEARNAIVAYDALPNWQPADERSLLRAHAVLMKGLVDDAGRYRKSGVGVLQGEQVLHMAPPAKRVPVLMQRLLKWLGSSDQHPLIVSSVFHYEFEFIHPFSDGNGRMGRLWQTLILSHWNPLFAHIPVESLINAHQAAYYQAIHASTAQSDSAPFIAFMLTMLRDAIGESAPQVSPHVTPQVERLLKCLQGSMSRDELQAALALKDRKSFRERYLLPALAAGLVTMTLPDKPNSRLQQYKLTATGQALAKKGNGKRVV